MQPKGLNEGVHP